MMMMLIAIVSVVAVTVRLHEHYPIGHPLHKQLYLRVKSDGNRQDAYVPADEQILRYGIVSSVAVARK